MSSHPRTPRAGASSARICISALSGGGGKTLLSLGLARAFSRQGLAVQPFKKGPDYIDAAWLSLAAGRQASNLDPYFLSPARLRALFRHVMGRSGARLALLEGNRGLFDGMDVRGSCATAELARTLDCPVLLSLDCTKDDPHGRCPGGRGTEFRARPASGGRGAQSGGLGPARRHFA